ncbi:general stress protein [Paenibacillus pini]|uniref:General stress protein 17M-like domain-containing protein n=1 Tax=Paenibacillus pini JCM 16418 TaxID=1236976 RepID=W7YRD4_9BACL|nr:general stress protein [Paenibacillus pini]GAF07126.1 hypothetical protein JCM16418_1116 [Paenibacillus pini JCM 16418]
MAQLLVAIFKTRQDTALAIQDLEEAGYHKKDISLLGKNKLDLVMICHDAGLKEPKAGVGNTGVFGEVKNIISSLEIGSQITWAVGPAVPKLAGATIGTDADELVVGLIGLGIPQKDAEQYEDHLIKERIILMMESTLEQSKELLEILESHDCIGLNET